MNQTIHENLKSVAGVSKDMLENIEKVRGEKYASVVRMMLMCSSIAKIATLLVDDEVPEEGIRALMEALSSNLSGITSMFMDLNGIDEEGAVLSVIKDVESISSAVADLGRQAVEAGRQGKPFGDA